MSCVPPLLHQGVYAAFELQHHVVIACRNSSSLVRAKLLLLILLPCVCSSGLMLNTAKAHVQAGLRVSALTMVGEPSPDAHVLQTMDKENVNCRVAGIPLQCCGPSGCSVQLWTRLESFTYDKASTVLLAATSSRQGRCGIVTVLDMSINEFTLYDHATSRPL